MGKYIVEMLGTFFLVTTVGCALIGGAAGVLAPVAIAAVLMVMIYAGGHISGAHYNPAVSFGVWLRGKCSTSDLAPYVAAQLAGAALAATVVGFLRAGVAVTAASFPVAPALAAEFLFTFALVFVVLNVATAKGTVGNSFYGVAIAGTVLAGAIAVGGLSGGVFNPAVAVGLAMMGLLSWGSLGSYIAAQLVAALVAAVTFKFVSPSDR